MPLQGTCISRRDKCDPMNAKWKELTRLAFSPAYSGLTNNVPTTLQNLKGFPWPEGTPDFVNVRDKQRYIQGYSKAFNIEPLIRYNTRVERLQKIDRKWQLKLTTLVKDEVGGIEKVPGKEVRFFDEENVAFLTCNRSSILLWLPVGIITLRGSQISQA